MRRSTTSVATDRRRSRTRLAALLITELICALLLVGRSDVAPGPTVATPASLATPTAASTATVIDGRTVRLVGVGGERTDGLLARVAAEMDGAVAAVTAFWGTDWPRELTIVGAATDEQFAALGGGDLHTAATATAERITFAPGAPAMSDAALRIVLRHELFHYAARERTAADAPRWLTEGVADFVARPPAAPPDGAVMVVPTAADLSGPERALAYDRAWWFARFVADRYGAPALRDLYVRACTAGHPDVATAVRDALGVDLASLLVQWRQWASR